MVKEKAMKEDKCMGYSHGIKMSFQEHVENHPDKEVLRKWKVSLEIQDLKNRNKDKKAEQLLKREFGSLKNFMMTFEQEVQDKIYKGWDPIIEDQDLIPKQSMGLLMR